MTPEELAKALDEMAETDILRAFSDAMERKGADQLDDDDRNYLRLFGAKPQESMSNEDADNYERLFGPQPDLVREPAETQPNNGGTLA